LKIDGWIEGACLSIGGDALALELKMNPTHDRSSLRVVVVDDNYDTNAALSRLLEQSGFQVTGRAYDGVAGFSVIKETSPDVAILDIAMPALDGYGLARRVKSELELPPRLVALTGYGDVSDKIRAANAGFDAHFCKPCDWPALESVLMSYLSPMVPPTQ
jgi:DNA-binding response OmpR family regulator